jgi:hypothetical protein
LFLMAEIDKRGNKIPTIFKYTISNASCAWHIWRRVQVAIARYSEAIALNAIQLGSVQPFYTPCVTYGNCWVMIVIFTDQNSLYCRWINVVMVHWLHSFWFDSL